MAKPRYAESQILSMLNQAEAGTPRYSVRPGKVMDRCSGGRRSVLKIGVSVSAPRITP